MTFGTMPVAHRDDLLAIAKILRSRGLTDDPLELVEMLQLSDMLLNIAEGHGCLAPRPARFRIVNGVPIP